MNYTAIIKDGGLFIPNVFSDLNDGQSHIVQVEVDIDDVRQQLSSNAAPKQSQPKAAAKKEAPKKYAKRQTKKELQEMGVHTLRKSAADELEAFDDVELSEMLKAYMNNEQEPAQISLENL